ncbi:hypothetical protein IAD21_05009 [Abditibacteriota bacterium]|nr:hypothetical protein IAD21_05009 [Abditibacteriota bacterium]
MPIFTFAAWLLLVWASGWFAFPILRRLCGHALPDGGLALGRIAFLVVWALLAFWLGQIGVPVAVSAGIYLPLAAVGVWSWWRERSQLKSDVRRRWRALLSAEAVFLCVFLVFFALRGYWSDTNGNNGEKSMDSALIGTLLRAQKLPPENPYAAGARLNSYYIFGHLETALVTRAANTTARWSYNLMCATLPALCFSALFSLGAGLTRRLDGGMFVSSTILGLGTLQPLFQWFRKDGIEPWPMLGGHIGPIRNLDFFAVSRPLPNAINEFPWFTFNQSDLHAHYFDFPIEIALMTLAWAIFRAPNERHRTVLLGVAALFSGAQILTNTWDFPAYALGVGLAFFLSPRKQDDLSASNGRRVLMFGGAMLAAVLLAAPYLLGINTAARGPSPLPQPASPLREWLLLWAPIAVSWMAFCAWATFRFDSRWRWGLGAIAVFVVVAATWGQADWGYPVGLDAQPQPTAVALNAWFTLGNPARLVIPLIVVFAFLAGISAYFNRGVTRFLPCLALAGLFAVLWSETTWAGFLGDPKYAAFADYKRQDTVFKFGLQGWFLWGTAATAGAYLTLRRWPLVLRLGFIPFLLVMAISSAVDTVGRTRGFDKSARQNWDAWGHMTSAEQDAATWLQTHTAPDENILEAEQKEGGDYTPYARYTHATGIATIIGPQAHSFQWSPNPIRVQRQPNDTPEEFFDRKAGAQWDEVFKRKREARTAFTTSNSEERREILKRYNVRYVMWGELEREQYGEQSRELLSHDLKVAESFGFGPNDDPTHRVQIFAVP